MATVEFVLGLQQAEEDLDWVGYFFDGDRGLFVQLIVKSEKYCKHC